MPLRRILPGMVLILALLSCRPGKQQVTGEGDQKMTFAFYNVENLYDTSDDPAADDQEFLPSSPKAWDDRKYEEKIADLSKVLKELGGDELPEVVGLCEVENEGVVKDLVAHPNLAEGKYGIVHFNDRDSRGIDMALIYRPAEFIPESVKLVPVRTREGRRMARGILAVQGKTHHGETFHIFINHWPSRENDDPATEAGRTEMAWALRQLVQGLEGEKSHVVIMGDMNDEPTDKSLLTELGASPPDSKQTRGLVNLMFPAYHRGEGTYKFRKEWRILDHIIVSRSLTGNTGFRVEDGKARIFSRPWMEYQYRNGDVTPDRTYLGDDYKGGPSDHFPVYIRLIQD